MQFKVIPRTKQKLVLEAELSGVSWCQYLAQEHCVIIRKPRLVLETGWGLVYQPKTLLTQLPRHCRMN